MEIWKKIENYPNYSVSNFGNIKNNKTDKLIYLNDKGGKYLSVSLYKNNKRKRFYVHRLVAMAFNLKEKNKEYVNHIDGNKHNNHYTNLEWVTASENTKHAFKHNLIDVKKISQSNKGKIKRSYEVYSYNLETKEIKKYNDIHDLFKIFKRFGVYQAIKTKKPYKNFLFSKTNDFLKGEIFMSASEKSIKINETKPIRLSRFLSKLTRTNLTIEDFEKKYINKTKKGEKQYIFFRKESERSK